MQDGINIPTFLRGSVKDARGQQVAAYSGTIWEKAAKAAQALKGKAAQSVEALD